MTALDSELQEAVSCVLAEFDSQATFTERSLTYDPDTGQTTRGTPTNKTVRISPPHFTDAPDSDSGAEGQGSTEVRTATIVIDNKDTDGNSFTPIRKQLFEFDGKKYRIVTLKPIYSGQQVCAHEAEVAR